MGSVRVSMHTQHFTHVRRDRSTPLPPDAQSLVRFADLLKLRSLAASTQAAYLAQMRQLAVRVDRDPATLTEEALRAHLLRLKTERHYSPSSMRTAVAAFTAFYNRHLGNDWRLFGLIRSPDQRTLPTVLTRAQLVSLFAAVRTDRYRMILRLIYACGLRISEAVALEVGDIEAEGTRVRVRAGKGNKDRLVPLPAWALTELRAFWKTHRHPRLLFPGQRRRGPNSPARAACIHSATRPMDVGSLQTCLRQVRTIARLPAKTCPHSLRHSYATHLLEEGVSIRLISAYLGHASLQTTMVYLHLTAVNEAGARAALERLRPN